MGARLFAAASEFSASEHSAHPLILAKTPGTYAMLLISL